jgi:type I restriction enzyme S subunit
LGGEVIHQLYGSPGFGHVKLMKAMVLLDLHVLPEVDLDTHYYRQAAGPYDNALIRSLDSQFEQQKWYKAVPIPGGGARYERLPKAGSHQKYFPGYWAPHQSAINRVLELLRPLSMRQSEIVATLYVAWNDMLLDGQTTPPDARIIEESTTAWNESKLGISPEEWEWGFQFIRQNDLVPRGQGQHSRISPAKR